MVGIRSHGSGTSGGNPNFRPPTEPIGPFDWAGRQVKIQSSVGTLQKRPLGQGSEVSIRAVFPRDRLRGEPSGKEGRDCALDIC